MERNVLKEMVKILKRSLAYVEHTGNDDEIIRLTSELEHYTNKLLIEREEEEREWRSMCYDEFMTDNFIDDY